MWGRPRALPPRGAGRLFHWRCSPETPHDRPTDRANNSHSNLRGRVCVLYFFGFGRLVLGMIFIDLASIMSFVGNFSLLGRVIAVPVFALILVGKKALFAVSQWSSQIWSGAVDRFLIINPFGATAARNLASFPLQGGQ